MSTTETTPNEETKKTIGTIESHLYQTLTSDHGYFNSKDIADSLDLNTKRVASLLKYVDRRSERLSIEKWAYTTSTTWLVKKQSDTN